MKRIIYLFTGVAFILVSTIRCEKESVGTDDLQTLQQEEILSKGGKKEKVGVCHYDAATDTWETLSINGNALQAHLNHGDTEGECSTIPTVFNPDTGRTWMDRNLGATQVATSSTDAASYGDLYQWGRGTDGHQIRTSGTTMTGTSSTEVPGHPNFILIGRSVSRDWLNPQNNNLWQPATGMNNPCPTGFRMPTIDEWEAERASWGSDNAAGAFASVLKLPNAGYRSHAYPNKTIPGGPIKSPDIEGWYWSSSTQNGPRIVQLSRKLLIRDLDVITSGSYRASGMSCRCIQD